MSTPLAPPLAVRRPLNPKTDPINGHKGVDLGDGAQLVSVRMAICQALYEEMQRDPTIYIMGEEVAQYNGAYKVTKGLLDVFGPERVIDSPITENGFAGLAVGAAMTGLRPVIEFMSWNFSFVAFDQIISNASKMNYMTGAAPARACRRSTRTPSRRSTPTSPASSWCRPRRPMTPRA